MADSWLNFKLWFEIPKRGLPFTPTRRSYNRQMRCLKAIADLEESLLGIKDCSWPSWFAKWACSWDGCGWALSPGQKEDQRREKRLKAEIAGIHGR